MGGLGSGFFFFFFFIFVQLSENVLEVVFEIAA